MSQNLSSAAVVIGTLRVKMYNIVYRNNYFGDIVGIIRNKNFTKEGFMDAIVNQ